MMKKIVIQNLNDHSGIFFLNKNGSWTQHISCENVRTFDNEKDAEKYIKCILFNVPNIHSLEIFMDDKYFIQFEEETFFYDASEGPILEDI
jgi:hypothetical protein